MRIGLQKRIPTIAPEINCSDVLRDVGKIKATKVNIKDEELILRTELTGNAHLAFKAVNRRPPSKIIYSVNYLLDPAVRAAG